jgi:triacylglycerol esterase/lipase EstA (alpha/beta hydrolase family)
MAMIENVTASSAVVLVPGFLTPKNVRIGELYWGTAVNLSTQSFPVIPIATSGVASLHDRACDIFAQLTGTTVDYGEDHSTRHGHSRFGRVYTKALFPHWSEKCPIHLVGHSFGGPTCQMLRHLCDSGFFGVNVNGCWVKSITTISAPHNG